jgi:hypothetical protein
MTRDADPEAKPGAGWAEHTVVASLPRRFPVRSAPHAPLSQLEEAKTLVGIGRPQAPSPPQPDPASRELGRPLSEVEEPRTVVGEAPSRATAQQLIARYAALASAPPPAPDEAASGLSSAPPRPWLRRSATFAHEDFRRAPRIVRLLLPALPLIAAATTFLDVDPGAPTAGGAVAVAATVEAATSAPAASPLPSVALPNDPAAIVRHPGRTLAADAADAAARGDRRQAVAAYAQLAREHPEVSAYASAARILMRDKERDRPAANQ